MALNPDDGIAPDALPIATTVSDGDLLLVFQEGVLKQISHSTFFAHLPYNMTNGNGNQLSFQPTFDSDLTGKEVELIGGSGTDTGGNAALRAGRDSSNVQSGKVVLDGPLSIVNNLLEDSDGATVEDISIKGPAAGNLLFHQWLTFVDENGSKCYIPTYWID